MSWIRDLHHYRSRKKLGDVRHSLYTLTYFYASIKMFDISRLCILEYAQSL